MLTLVMEYKTDSKMATDMEAGFMLGFWGLKG